MSAVPKKKRLTVEEYLAIENAAESRSEFFDGEMFAMAGATSPHNFIKDNCIYQLRKRLDGGPYTTASSDQRVLFDRTGLYTYPDIVVVCGEPEFDPKDSKTLVNPRVLVEVLSPSTEHNDRTMKFDHFRILDSAREYVLVSQDEPRVERFARGDDGRWTHDAFTGLEATITLVSVGAKDIPLADIYKRIAFPERARSDAR